MSPSRPIAIRYAGSDRTAWAARKFTDVRAAFNRLLLGDYTSARVYDENQKLYAGIHKVKKGVSFLLLEFPLL